MKISKCIFKFRESRKKNIDIVDLDRYYNLLFNINKWFSVSLG